MRAQPLVSIVIPTLNRVASLRRTVAYFISEERYDPFELIVVDQSQAPPPEFPAGGSVATNDSRITHVRVDYRSLPRARNDGVRRARGDVILFVDDDVLPLPGFVHAHARAYRDAAVWGATGPVLSPGSGTDQPAHDGRSEGDAATPEWATWAAGCNMSFRRSVIERVGGFDERFFGVALGEDAEFCHRVIRAGGRIRVARDARLIHYAVPNGGCRDVASEAQRTHDLAANTVYFWSRVSRARSHARELLGLFRRTVVTRGTLRQRTVLRNASAFIAGIRHGHRLAVSARCAE